MFSFEAVADGKFHKFQMLVEKTNLTMIVDSGPPRTVVNDGPNKRLIVDDPLYLGGLPADVNARATQKWHIREGSSFIGKNKCMIECENIFKSEFFISCLIDRLAF